MKKTITLILLSGIALQANENNNIQLTNFSNSSKIIEINNDVYEIKLNSTLRVPCVENEVLEMLNDKKFENLLCGTKKELN